VTKSTEHESTAPRVRLRLSSTEMRLILPSLRQITAADCLWNEQGRIVRAAVDPAFYLHDLNTDLYHPAGMKPFWNLLSSLSNLPAQGGRVRVCTFQVAAAAVAVRQTRTAVRHGHLPPFQENHRAVARCLLRKLERYRRRARRLFEKRLGTLAYEASANTWRATVAWVRGAYTWCACRRARGWSFMHRLRRTVVDRCVVLACEGLKRRYVHPPHPAKLRLMVRRALRAARRRKTGFGIRTILTEPIIGGDFLAAYIVKNHAEQLQHFDLATNQSELRERLAQLFPACC
jgi:hypothetical protein